ncbi:MAG: hypothetical protein AAF481_06735 [Acidobacteriota bacterium]
MNAKDSTERLLWRDLHGELSAAERRGLEERLAADPALAAERDRLAVLWQGLELPEPQPVPLGLTERIMARARERRRTALPPWIRAASAAALAGGLVLGVGLGSLAPEAVDAVAETAEVTDAGSPDAGSPDAGSPDAGSPDAGSAEAGGLADEYWRMLEAFESDAAAAGGLEG